MDNTATVCITTTAASSRADRVTVAGSHLDALAATEAAGTTIVIELTNSVVDREDLRLAKEQLV